MAVTLVRVALQASTSAAFCSADLPHARSPIASSADPPREHRMGRIYNATYWSFVRISTPTEFLVKTILLMTIIVTCTGLAGCRSKDRGSFDALQRRGDAVMGVDQYTSAHRFEPLSDGGRIELQREVDDSAGVVQIRRHLRGIAQAFASGQFDQPMLVHARDVPGTAVMAERRSVITYAYRDLPRGGEVRISSRDSIAIVAIHEFLAFQRSEHHAGM